MPKTLYEEMMRVRLRYTAEGFFWRLAWADDEGTLIFSFIGPYPTLDAAYRNATG